MATLEDRLLLLGARCALALIPLMAAVALATDLFVFPYVSTGFSGFGAALPSQTIIAYELRWTSTGAFTLVTLLAFAIRSRNVRERTLLVVSILGVHALPAYVASFVSPVATLLRAP